MNQLSYYRTIWISDIHLGTRACKADALLDFLHSHIADTLYLVGDIVDGWNQGRGWHWSAAQAAVANEIGRWRRMGTKVVFLPGNHDESNVNLVEELLGRLPSVGALIHTTAAGAKMLVTHGHQFDGSLNLNRLFPKIGMHGYTPAQRIYDWYQSRGGQRAEDSRRMSDYLRDRTKRAVEFLTDFRDRAVLSAAFDHRVDGVICGHIHRSEHRKIGSIIYMNDGDWVHSRTAVVEEHSGALQVVRWNDRARDGSEIEPMRQEIAS